MNKPTEEPAFSTLEETIEQARESILEKVTYFKQNMRQLESITFGIDDHIELSHRQKKMMKLLNDSSGLFNRILEEFDNLESLQEMDNEQ